MSKKNIPLSRLQMNSLRAFQRTFQTATTTSLRNTSRNYSSFAVRPRSPFLELLGRYRSRRPEKHLFLRRRNFASQAEQKNVPSPKPGSPTDPNRSFSQRFKDLTRKYGWAALGTYFALSILDYPFFFLAVRSVGTDRIGQYEHAVSEWIKATVPFEIPTIQWPWQKQGAESEGSENQKEGEASQKKDLESEKKTEASKTSG